MVQKQRLWLFFIFILLIGAIATLIYSPLQLGLDLRGGSQLTIQVKPTEEVTEISKDDLEAVKRVIENRINALGVSEPVVRTVGNEQIEVQLAGVTNPAQAERVLGGTTQLEFREQRAQTEQRLAIERQVLREKQLRLLLLRQANNTENQIDELTKPEEAEKRSQEIAKLNEEIAQSREAIAKLFKEVDLTGTSLTGANPQPMQNGGWEVAIRFDDEGGQKFADLTKNLAGTGRSLGIFLDNVLISSPTVGPQFAVSGITGGQAVINGNFSAEEANDLAIQIRGGSLPFPVEVVENRTVGATLGANSIRRSIYAGIAGLILVLIFMVSYYRLPGLIANLALAIYTILTLGCYALVGVVLTLPGIAGFILSIGMAVDANVLIFERTREELRNGKTLYRSVESGFFRAFSSILDSNVTTLIACGALFWLGSGLVKGFALTLAIGVSVSLFTALTCSRTLLLLTVLGLPKVRQKPELFCPKLLQTAKS